MRKIMFSICILLPVAYYPAHASETVSYTYDDQGRLIQAVYTGGGPNNGLDIKYELDLAGNRVTQKISGSKNTGQRIVVIPLNGFTIIPKNP